MPCNLKTMQMNGERTREVRAAGATVAIADNRSARGTQCKCASCAQCELQYLVESEKQIIHSLSEERIL